MLIVVTHCGRLSSNIFIVLIFLVYGDGSGYNLKPVVVGDNALKAITDQNLAFFFHPCGDIKTLPIHFTYETDNECRLGYTLCMYNSTENTARILGNQENMKFQLDGDTMQVIFITGGTSDNSRSSISLECAQTLKNSILYAPQEKIEQVVSFGFHFNRAAVLKFNSFRIF